jgi:regulatory protein
MKERPVKELTEAEGLYRMAAYCTSAERCREEVGRKLRDSGLPEEAIRRITSRLVEEKFIDEARYCRSFVNDKLRLNHWGRIKISSELRRRGLPEALITAALCAIDADEYEEILSALLKEKSKTVRGREAGESYYKLLRFAASRGFEPALAGACLRQSGISCYDDETTTD